MRIPVLSEFLLRRIFAKRRMQFPPFDSGIHEEIVFAEDYVRYASIAMALQRVVVEQIPGSLAEAGVYLGATSRFVHRMLPDRPYYLFDTFEGFSSQDLSPGSQDQRFRDTSVESVLRTIGDTRNIMVREGHIPETFAGLENERFAFVVIDLDLHDPTVASLDFFYPRLSAGAFCLVHDFNNSESDWACKKALTEFMQDKAESPIEIPDVWGTALFRKTRNQ